MIPPLHDNGERCGCLLAILFLPWLATMIAIVGICIDLHEYVVVAAARYGAIIMMTLPTAKQQSHFCDLCENRVDSSRMSWDS